MSVRRAVPALLVLLCAAPMAFGMASEPRNPPPQTPGTAGFPGTPSGTGDRNLRQEAEESYALAYEEVGKAKKDLEDGKAKSAEKRFRRALERCEKAVLLDERYHEAWNLVGYTARRTGDLDKAFKAYERCLTLKPDYAPAREYLGEAWLDKGDAKKAGEQLVWLERLQATEEARTLRARLEAWSAVHPDSAAVPPATPAQADSGAAGGRTSGQ